MNFTEIFDQFASRLTTTDLALYAGAGLVLWVLFKDNLSPVQSLLLSVVEKVKAFLGSSSKVPLVPVFVPTVPVLPVSTNQPVVDNDDLFFKLVVSWKQTRDLAVQSNCNEAVKAADQMFPYLSPTVCSKKEDVVS